MALIYAYITEIASFVQLRAECLLICTTIEESLDGRSELETETGAAIISIEVHKPNITTSSILHENLYCMGTSYPCLTIGDDVQHWLYWPRQGTFIPFLSAHTWGTVSHLDTFLGKNIHRLIEVDPRPHHLFRELLFIQVKRRHVRVKLNE